jgi:molybdopterin molybdotransferase
LKVVGESRAGEAWGGVVGEGECVRIMTGAAVPEGADAVVMVEYAEERGGHVYIEKSTSAGEHIVAAGSEAKKGQVVVRRGARLGFAELAMAAQVGAVELKVAKRPRVAIVSTGDEVVGAAEKPGAYQIRNSNSVSLAAQVELAGGEAVQLGNARDEEKELRKYLERGLEEDVLVVSGGVSAGKYDLVEGVLGRLGAKFYFDGIAIRPGKPAVFGECQGKLVFGLPGNPVSTMVTFEVLVVPAIDVLSGTEARELALFKARIKHDLKEKPELAHFLPARATFGQQGAEIETVKWMGSGDVVAVTEANCFVVVDKGSREIKEGEVVGVMLRRGCF